MELLDSFFSKLKSQDSVKQHQQQHQPIKPVPKFQPKSIEDAWKEAVLKITQIKDNSEIWKKFLLHMTCTGANSTNEKCLILNADFSAILMEKLLDERNNTHSLIKLCKDILYGTLQLTINEKSRRLNLFSNKSTLDVNIDRTNATALTYVYAILTDNNKHLAPLKDFTVAWKLCIIRHILIYTIIINYDDRYHEYPKILSFMDELTTEKQEWSCEEYTMLHNFSVLLSRNCCHPYESFRDIIISLLCFGTPKCWFCNETSVVL
jgi:hypothetical protein